MPALTHHASTQFEDRDIAARYHLCASKIAAIARKVNPAGRAAIVVGKRHSSGGDFWLVAVTCKGDAMGGLPYADVLTVVEREPERVTAERLHVDRVIMALN